MINPDAQKIIDRLGKAAENYGKVWNPDKILEAMKRHYELLGVPMPKAVFVDCDKEGFEKARDATWDAARDAARGAAWDAAWGAARGAAAINTSLTDTATLRFTEIELELLKAFENGLGIFFPMKDVLILCPNPILRVNGRQMLHSETQPAVEWKNDKYFFLNGVKFPEDLWKKVTTKTATPKEILGIQDIDQRTQAMKFLPAVDFFRETKAELIDKSKRGNELYKIDNLFRVPAYFTFYKCPSTGNEYIHGIDPEFAAKSKDADECVAWMFKLSPKEYKQLTVEA